MLAHGRFRVLQVILRIVTVKPDHGCTGAAGELPFGFGWQAVACRLSQEFDMIAIDTVAGRQIFARAQGIAELDCVVP